MGVGTAAEFSLARFRFFILFPSYLRVEVGGLAGREWEQRVKSGVIFWGEQERR